MTIVEQLIKKYNIAEDGIDCRGIQYQRVEKAKRTEDLCGQRFDRLTALFTVLRPNNNHQHWLCLCDCGNLKVVYPPNLKRKLIRSCGCFKRECNSKWLISVNNKRRLELKGQEIGDLLVLELSGRKEGNHYYWKCLCKRCGTIEDIRSDILTSGSKISCCNCSKIHSQGENRIKDLLNNANIPFEQEKRFKTCIFPDTKAQAKFDFFVDNKYLIEYDGIQHYRETTYVGFDYNKIQEHDKIKNEWCFKNNIKLIRIPYTHLSKLCLKDLLLETSDFIIKQE